MGVRVRVWRERKEIRALGKKEKEKENERVRNEEGSVCVCVFLGLSVVSCVLRQGEGGYVRNGEIVCDVGDTRGFNWSKILRPYKIPKL